MVPLVVIIPAIIPLVGIAPLIIIPLITIPTPTVITPLIASFVTTSVITTFIVGAFVIFLLHLCDPLLDVPSARKLLKAQPMG